MIWEGINKRKFPRAKYKCRILISDHGKELVFDTFTENIGGGGICVALDKELDLFGTAKLELYLIENGPPISCNGTVVWVIKRRVGSKPIAHENDIGIEFVDMQDEDRAKVAELVKQILNA